MRRTILIVMIILLLVVIISGCTSKPEIIEASSDPLTFASPYLPYITKSQDELIKGLKLNEDDLIFVNDLMIALKEPVMVDGNDYTAVLRFENNEDEVLFHKFTYTCELETPDRAGAYEAVKNIYDVMVKEYGEPAGQQEVYKDATVQKYLENDGGQHKISGEFQEFWVVMENVDYPYFPSAYGREVSDTEDHIITARLYITVLTTVTTIKVDYIVSRRSESAIVFD